jgi:hypothetical protein
MFVGREDELAILGRLVAATAAGSAGTLLIAGEAGIGKTRLVAELRRIAGDAQASLGSGGSVSLGEGSLPFGPVSGALHDLLAGFDDVELHAILGHRAAALVQILPGLADRLPTSSRRRRTSSSGRGSSRAPSRHRDARQPGAGRPGLRGSPLGRPGLARPDRLPHPIAAAGRVLIVGTYRAMSSTVAIRSCRGWRRSGGRRGSSG